MSKSCTVERMMSRKTQPPRSLLPSTLRVRANSRSRRTPILLDFRPVTFWSAFRYSQRSPKMMLEVTQGKTTIDRSIACACRRKQKKRKETGKQQLSLETLYMGEFYTHKINQLLGNQKERFPAIVAHLGHASHIAVVCKSSLV